MENCLFCKSLQHRRAKTKYKNNNRNRKKKITSSERVLSGGSRVNVEIRVWGRRRREGGVSAGLAGGRISPHHRPHHHHRRRHHHSIPARLHVKILACGSRVSSSDCGWLLVGISTRGGGTLNAALTRSSTRLLHANRNVLSFLFFNLRLTRTVVWLFFFPPPLPTAWSAAALASTHTGCFSCGLRTNGVRLDCRVVS